MKRIAKWVVMTFIVTAILIEGFHTSEVTYAIGVGAAVDVNANVDVGPVHAHSSL
jgi:hypothetical protein